MIKQGFHSYKKKENNHFKKTMLTTPTKDSQSLSIRIRIPNLVYFEEKEQSKLMLFPQRGLLCCTENES